MRPYYVRSRPKGTWREGGNVVIAVCHRNVTPAMGLQGHIPGSEYTVVRADTVHILRDKMNYTVGFVSCFKRVSLACLCIIAQGSSRAG